MTYPSDATVIDTMIGLPFPMKGHYEQFKPLMRDKESLEEFEMPAQYMFTNVPNPQESSDYGEVLISEMDRFNIERGLVGVTFEREETIEALRRWPERLMGCFSLKPNEAMDGVRNLVRAKEELGVIAAMAFPCGENPQVPINDKKFFPFYAKCVELDLPVFICAGTPGPRVPLAAQKVELLDEVCCYFP